MDSSTNKSALLKTASADLAKITTYQSGVVQSAAHRQLKKLTDSCLQKHGLTTMQWFIVGTVLDSGKSGIRITDLAKKLDTTLSFLTHVVNLLESKKILTRVAHQDDSRSKMVAVSKKFRPKCSAIEKDLRNELRKKLYAKISPEELRVYIKVLYQFADLDD